MYGIYEYVWFFLIYACLGWCAEVAFAAVKTGKFVNRGFLNGPVCPIYGCGVCLVVFCLSPIQKNLLLLFLGAVLLTSAIELVTGFVLEKIYHEHWWDYSQRPLNFKGYICLEFSLLWGVACVAVLRLVHPLIAQLIRWLPNVIGLILAAALLSALLIDFAATVVDLHRFRKTMNMVQGVTAKLRELSDDMGENISSGVLSAVRKGEQLQAEASARREEKQERYLEEKANFLLELHTRLSRSDFNRKRLTKAFPSLKKSEIHRKSEEFRELVQSRIQKARN